MDTGLPSQQATSCRDRQTPPNSVEVINQSLNDKIRSLKADIQSTIHSTNWPTAALRAAEGLRKTVEYSPTVPVAFSKFSEEIQKVIDQYILTLEDVHTRLKDASSKPGKRQWNVIEKLKTLSTAHRSKCTLIFQSCQADITKSVDRFNECLKSNFEDNEQAQIQSANFGIPSTLSSGNLHGAGPNLPSIRTGSSANPGSTDPMVRSPIRPEVLTAARKTFKSLDIVSSSIPVAGSFVGAVAKVGLAFVETVQTMDQNEELAKDLGLRTTRLSTLLQHFNDGSATGHRSLIAEQVTELQNELQDMQAKVKEWESKGRFARAFSSRDHAETLKGHQGRVQTALEELQFLAGLNVRDLAVELRSIELQKERQRLLDRLGDGKYGARGDILEDILCFPGTRVAVLGRADDWNNCLDAAAENRARWISGMAGRGKSTIASTVIHNWKSRATCAIFHFRRGQTAVNGRVVCALARQLGNGLDPEVRKVVLDVVRENQDIADRLLEDQFETLLVAPMSKLRDHTRPILLAIDALDEADGKEAITLIKLIDRHSPSFPPNVHFLLTCRPEGSLPRILGSLGWRKEDLDSDADVVNDLDIFIEQKCKLIRDGHGLPESWPAPEAIGRLVEMSQCLFQWARTVMLYIDEGSPVDRLRRLLQAPQTWSGLDELYHQIFQKAFHNVEFDADRKELMQSMLATIVVAPVPVHLEALVGLFGHRTFFDGMTPPDIAQFLRQDILADFASLISVPKSLDEPLVLMHASIGDLLTSKTRCKDRSYQIDSDQHHRQLGDLCLGHMVKSLQKNIYELPNHWQSSSEVPDGLKRKLSRTLRYCCLAWSAHLTKGSRCLPSDDVLSTSTLSDFRTFSEEKVLLWLEVLSLVGAIPDALRMTQVVHQWLLKTRATLRKYVVLWNDVRRFVSKFAVPLAYSPWHIYTSALPSCPMETELWKYYASHATVKTIKGGSKTWSPNLWTRSVGEEVITTSFSPDGQWIVVVTNDGTVQFHEPNAGDEIGKHMVPVNKLVSQFNWITAAALSQDGKLLAYGCDDGSIGLWDTHTTESVNQQLESGSDRIASVAFSPDTRILASGSADGAIRLWDTVAGHAICQPHKCPGSSPYSTKFSPDGRLLASLYTDSTIRLWDPLTGDFIGQILEKDALCVAFCPKTQTLVTGSTCGTIRFWDTQIWSAKGKAIEVRHDVYSISFSPDGKALASVSRDNIIRIWDANTGNAIVQPFKCHPHDSVSFSPGGETLVSGSHDGTVRLWDVKPHDKALEQEIQSRSAMIISDTLSPDSILLAYSLREDPAIQLWDTRTGDAVIRLGHSSKICAISISPDGAYLALAFGFRDMTIQLWDLDTRKSICQIPKAAPTGIYTLSFSQDGKSLASVQGLGSQVQLWNTLTGDSKCQPFGGHHIGISAIAFSPDGTTLASASYSEPIIRMWDAHTGESVGQLLAGPSDSFHLIMFSSDSKVLASVSSSDNAFQLWNVSTGELIGGLSDPRTGWLDFAPFRLDGSVYVVYYMKGRLLTLDAVTSLSGEGLLDPQSLDSSKELSSHAFLWHHSLNDPCAFVFLNRPCRRLTIITDESQFYFLDVSQIYPVL